MTSPIGMGLLDGSSDSGLVVPTTKLAADRNPALVYVASLAPGSRRTMRKALAVIANMIAPGLTAEAFPWHHVRFQHAAAIRTRLAERCNPSAKDVGCAGSQFVIADYERATDRAPRQQRLNFFPEPQGQGSLRVGRERAA